MSRASGRRKKEPRERAVVYWRKAGRFARAARRNGAEGDWDPAVANAINAVINLADALCVHYRGERSAGEAHHEAIAVLGSVAELDPETRRALEDHLGALLDRKGLAQYEGRLLEKGDAEAAVRHLERAAKPARALAGRLGWPLGEGP